MNKKQHTYEYAFNLATWCQRIGIVMMVLTWLLFLIFWPSDPYRPFIWMGVVIMQFLVIGKWLECRIPIWYEKMPKIKAKPVVKWFVFWGVAVLFFQCELIIPIHQKILILLGIWICAKCIYNLSRFTV